MRRFQMARRLGVLPLLMLSIVPAPQAVRAGDADYISAIRVPEGFTIERVAGPPLIERPMMAGFDDRGRLFVADSAGVNRKSEELLKDPPHNIRMLEDTHGDGKFDRSTLLADKMVFPQGACWHDGALYVCSPPSLWKLEDPGPDGLCRKRTEIVKGFGFTGNAADIHGPFFGPDGRLYWCDGRHGHRITLPDGSVMEGKAAGIFRCKPDGSELEEICGGGMDNPVAIAFTPEGEALATCNIFQSQPRRVDVLFYAIDGGVFPWNSVFHEFKQTGEPLPSIADLGWVAAAGFTRYRGTSFGPQFKDNFFSAQFNPHRVQRHIVERDGASFRVRTEDFLVSSNPDFHPTDVVEDADGSLLVIDTGGWFRIGCPNSQIAKPHVMGAIYRVRRKDAPAIEDPRGLKLAWGGTDVEELIARLRDGRPIVVDRAIAVLVEIGDQACPALESLAAHGSGSAARDAVWILSRIDTAAARRAVRRALASEEPSVRQVAARSVGLRENGGAVGELMAAMADKSPSVAREAALSLGRIGDPKALPALFAAMRGGKDRFLEHAILYAMIQIHDPGGTLRGLADADSAIRRAALIAMDQMDGGKLSPRDVLPMLDPADPAARQAALWVLSNHAEWGGEMLEFFRTELAHVDEKQTEAMKLELLAFCRDGKIQRLVAETLRDEKTSTAVRLLLLESIAEAPLDILPAEWAEPLAKGLRDHDDRVTRQALIAMRSGALSPRKEKAHRVDRSDFVEPLLELARESNRAAELRAGGLAVAAPFIEHLEGSLFEFAVSCLQKEKAALLRSTAAEALGHCRLDDAQLLRLASHIAGAGPMEAPKLVWAFANSKSGEVGRALVDALGRSHGVNGLRPETLGPILAGYPEEVRRQGEALLSRLSADKEKQKAHLAELQPVLSGGNAAAGRELFFGNKAACATCHTVQNHGGRVGPDLSNIGAIRSGADILESIAFPSASFVRGYEPYIVKTKDGEVLDGIIARETADAIYLYNVQRIETCIARSNIADVQPSAVSLMPEGFDSQLSRQELADVMAFLQSLK